MNFLKLPAITIVIIFFSNCSGPNDPKEESSQKLNSSIPATEVKVVKATVKPFEYFISASGKIASAAEVRMQFRRAGIIEKVYVGDGQIVLRGQLVTVLNNDAQKLALSKAELVLKEKKLTFADQMISYVNDSVRQKKVNENIRVSSGLAGAELTYEEAKLEFENSFVRAQISGVVSGIELHSGSPVNQGDLLCFIHDPANLMVQAEVLESDALLLSKGTLAEVKPMTSAEETYTAKVESINPRVDDKTGLVKVVLRLAEKSKAFPGMHVRATLRLPYNKNIIIPKEAVVIRSGKPVVFTASNGLAKWNYVTLGRENGKEVEILEGLKAEDEVITTNNLQLAHDATVTVAK